MCPGALPADLVLPQPLQLKDGRKEDFARSASSLYKEPLKKSKKEGLCFLCFGPVFRKIASKQEGLFFAAHARPA
jgi:hypothetical protein